MVVTNLLYVVLFVFIVKVVIGYRLLFPNTYVILFCRAHQPSSTTNMEAVSKVKFRV